jgi:hypothetical protein
MNDELKKQLVRSIDFPGLPTIKHVPQPIYQAQGREKLLENDQAAKGCQLMRLKAEIYLRVCFTIDYFSA